MVSTGCSSNINVDFLKMANHKLSDKTATAVTMKANKMDSGKLLSITQTSKLKAKSLPSNLNPSFLIRSAKAYSLGFILICLTKINF